MPILTWVYQRADGQKRLLNASNSPPLLILISSTFPIAFKHHIFPAFKHYFFPCLPSLIYQTTHKSRQSYLNVCDRCLTNISSLRMGYLSASFPIGDRRPAPHSLRCRCNVTQCFVLTNIILYPSLFLCLMIMHRSFLCLIFNLGMKSRGILGVMMRRGGTSGQRNCKEEWAKLY